MKARRRTLAVSLLAAAAGLLAAPSAFGHVERASYFPNTSSEMVEGVPAGGGVPEARPLFDALDEGDVEETFVVCQTGQALTPPEPPTPREDQQVNRRADQQIDRELVNRLERKLASLRQKLRDGKDKEQRLKRKIARVKKRLAAALAAYETAVLAEELARNQGSIDYQRALALELVARQLADQQYQQALAQYLDDLDQYEEDVDADPSISDLDASIEDARDNGFVIRPSEGPQNFSGADATSLREFNVELLAECEYDEIQDAVDDAGNNDRVVVMPGIYEEPDQRAKPTLDPACDQYEEANDDGSLTGAVSYRYQFECPNDQNLIAIMGRQPKAGSGPGGYFEPSVPPDPSDPRRGIPDEGPCIRCNLQLEGSGVSPDDVVVEAGDVDAGDGQQYPNGPEEAAKDVALRADRADGFVLRNMKFRHSREHDVYLIETEGALIEKFKTRFNGEYGVLTFVAENQLIQDCDAVGSGDAAVYPGSSADRGEQAANPNYDADDPTLPHTGPGTNPADPVDYSTEIRRCDMRHSSTGYSGTAANSVWLHDNDMYDNAMGMVTDVFTASGHPGFPQDSSLIEDNEFYSNNFNPFLEECDEGETPQAHGPAQGCSDVDPVIPAPVGTAIFLPGVDNNSIRNNHMWNNWRRGTMLFSVPDSFVCGASPVAGGNQQHGCDETEVNTSHRNEQYGNVMGRSPNHPADPTWPSSGQNAEDPNGVDFWWDMFPGNVRNCWYDNIGPEGDEASITTDPPNPAPQPPVPVFPGEVIPCAASVGTGNPENEGELLDCLVGFETGNSANCTWFATPPEPPPD